jgi:Uma2 family endonuclease
MSDPAFRLLTEEEYLHTEELSPVRREFVDGFVYAQAGASLAHNQISSNLQRIFQNAVYGGPCRAYTADMKIQIRGSDLLKYYYPDFVVICVPHSDLPTVENNPCLLVEILSQSTRLIDMSFKAKDYLSLPSLQGYLLIDSEQQAAELYRRLPAGGWTQETMQDSLQLPCLNVNLTVDEIYESVKM